MVQVPPIVLLGGPTVSGKTGLALEVARLTGAEIVNVDAFQIYQGLDIGTGKMPVPERKGVPHHLFDIVAPTSSFSVAEYLNVAKEVIISLQQHQKPSIWVGGTGLYYRALRTGLSTGPASDPKVIEELEQISTEALVKEIQELDPEWSAQADLQNRRRLTRALAVWRQTGIPLSVWHRTNSPPVLPQHTAFFLNPDRQLLHCAIEQRVKAMWLQGWVEEVEQLRKLPGWESSQSASALGYRNIIQYLEGRLDKVTCIEQIITETRQYAKRQETWFRAEKNAFALLDEHGERIELLCQSLNS